jgi:hypothetical protein
MGMKMMRNIRIFGLLLLTMNGCSSPVPNHLEVSNVQGGERSTPVLPDSRADCDIFPWLYCRWETEWRSKDEMAEKFLTCFQQKLPCPPAGGQRRTPWSSDACRELDRQYKSAVGGEEQQRAGLSLCRLVEEDVNRQTTARQ